MKVPCASILPECRSPPRGLATARPSSNARRRQRIALETLTPKRAAAAWDKGLFADEFESGVYNVLRVLEAAQLPLFEAGEQGGPTDHFLDRLDDWEWPEQSAGQAE